VNKQKRNQMNDMTNDPTAKATQMSSATSATEQADKAAIALKTSVLTDAHDLTDEAKHVAGDVVTHARKSAENQISGGKDRIAEGLGSVAKAIRHTGEELRSKDEAGLTEYVTRAAAQVETASEYLKDRSLSEVLEDVGSFARREPAMFLGGAFVLGLIGGRFLKSSHVEPPRDTGRTGNTQTNFAQGGTPSANRHAGSRNNSKGRSSSRTTPGGYPHATEPKEKAPELAGSLSSGSSPYANGSAAKMPGAV
jgi:hypothetical protein